MTSLFEPSLGNTSEMVSPLMAVSSTVSGNSQNLPLTTWAGARAAHRGGLLGRGGAFPAQQNDL